MSATSYCYYSSYYAYYYCYYYYYYYYYTDSGTIAGAVIGVIVVVVIIVVVTIVICKKHYHRGVVINTTPNVTAVNTVTTGRCRHTHSVVTYS